MVITKFETWWVERGKCLFDEKCQGGAELDWDLIDNSCKSYQKLEA